MQHIEPPAAHLVAIIASNERAGDAEARRR